MNHRSSTTQASRRRPPPGVFQTQRVAPAAPLHHPQACEAACHGRAGCVPPASSRSVSGESVVRRPHGRGVGERGVHTLDLRACQGCSERVLASHMPLTRSVCAATRDNRLGWPSRIHSIPSAARLTGHTQDQDWLLFQDCLHAQKRGDYVRCLQGARGQALPAMRAVPRSPPLRVPCRNTRFPFRGLPGSILLARRRQPAASHACAGHLRAPGQNRDLAAS